MSQSHSIVLCTLNAKYQHASLGLRYLQANLGQLKPGSRLLEFSINQPADHIVERLIQAVPAEPEQAAARQQTKIIVGFGVYIWNVRQTTSVIQLLKLVRPAWTIVIGGPEVSHELHQQTIACIADHVITGAADHAFRELCQSLIDNETRPRVISALPLKPAGLELPYALYSDHDLQHRVVYVEASRGCPFKCEFCLSALDKTADAFDVEQLLGAFEQLIKRGARQFKFVDRTFNLSVKTAARILSFFLVQLDRTPLFLHFELIPDRLPDKLRTLVQQFPPGSLQFEIGIQTLNPTVQSLISRQQDQRKTADNLRWLRQHTEAHIHADLIFGLPGETLESFAAGFDALYALQPQEIQVGLLKRLRGTPIDRHTQPFAMRYQPEPPYRVLSTDRVDFTTMQRMVRFARYWDLLANSGRFPDTLSLLLKKSPFNRFMALCDWLHRQQAPTHRIALARWFNWLEQALPAITDASPQAISTALAADYSRNFPNSRPPIQPGAKASAAMGPANRRQQRHLPMIEA